MAKFDQKAAAGQHSLPTFVTVKLVRKYSQAFRLGLEAETLTCDGFRAHIFSRYIKTKSETSQTARYRRRSDTKA